MIQMSLYPGFLTVRSSEKSSSSLSQQKKIAVIAGVAIGCSALYYMYNSAWYSQTSNVLQEKEFSAQPQKSGRGTTEPFLPKESVGQTEIRSVNVEMTDGSPNQKEEGGDDEDSPTKGFEKISSDDPSLLVSGSAPKATNWWGLNRLIKKVYKVITWS